VDLARDFRSPEFQAAQNYVLKDVKARYPPGSPYGVSNLPPGAREAAGSVVSFYITLGAYATLGLADEALVVQVYGYKADQARVNLEHLIVGLVTAHAYPGGFASRHPAPSGPLTGASEHGGGRHQGAGPRWPRNPGRCHGRGGLEQFERQGSSTLHYSAAGSG
jgi:hypothetical protein